MTTARRDFCFAGDLAKSWCCGPLTGKGRGTYHFSTGNDVAIKELYDAVVRAMKLNHYPEPEITDARPRRRRLDPARSIAHFQRLWRDFALRRSTRSLRLRWTTGKHAASQGGHTPSHGRRE